MVYDLTSLLTTVSAGSASFIAIIGGLIATKLIDINNQRAAVDEEMEELADKRGYIEAINDHLGFNLSMDETLDFISDHCSVFFKGVMKPKMEKIVFDESLFKDLDGSEDLDGISLYWNMGQEILLFYFSSVPFDRKISEAEEAAVWNSIRNEFKGEYVPEFFYNGLSNLIRDMRYYIVSGRQSIINGESIVEPSPIAKPINGYGISVEVSNEWANELEKNLNNIGFIEMRLEQLSEKRKQLKHPGGLKLGFALFGLFIFFCVILPLLFVPFQTEDCRVYLIVKILFILILSTGLYGCLAYLISMLKSKADN